MTRVGFFAEQANHHPDLDIRWRNVRVALSTHDAGGLTEKDLALAGEIEGVAPERGLTDTPCSRSGSRSSSSHSRSRSS